MTGSIRPRLFVPQCPLDWAPGVIAINTHKRRDKWQDTDSRKDPHPGTRASQAWKPDGPRRGASDRANSRNNGSETTPNTDSGERPDHTDG